jgi:hypothetical protein
MRPRIGCSWWRGFAKLLRYCTTPSHCYLSLSLEQELPVLGAAPEAPPTSSLPWDAGLWASASTSFGKTLATFSSLLVELQLQNSASDLVSQFLLQGGYTGAPNQESPRRGFDFMGSPRSCGWGSPYRASCRWISCRKNMGYHMMDPKIRTRGLNA